MLNAEAMPNECMDLSLNPSVAEPMDHHRGMTWEIWVLCNAQAVRFKCSREPSSFFLSVPRSYGLW